MENGNICKQELNIYFSDKDFNVWFSHSYEHSQGLTEKIGGFEYSHPTKGWFR